MDTHTERQFLTSLINTISAEPIPDTIITSNPLKAFSSPDSNIRQIFLTLHVLYPNELLPALDLLDRGLLYQLSASAPQNQEARSLPAQKRIYHVRSAQEPPSWQRKQQHHSHRAEIADAGAAADEMRADVTYYETRPWAWNCGCPAFAFAAFPAAVGFDQRRQQQQHQSSVEVSDAQYEDIGVQGVTERTGGERHREWMVGGLMRGVDAPVCKHLLACVLVEHCGGLFGRFVKEREASLDEIVAWGAGWGG